MENPTFKIIYKPYDKVFLYKTKVYKLFLAKIEIMCTY
jgi:hypothetical protein